MDPNATWTELLQALIDDDWPAAYDAAEALAEWLRRGGFPPQIVTRFPPEDPLHRRFALAVCARILQGSGESGAAP
ncbi:MAG: hypothetical protein DWQ35_15885 [Planctomycetota bacterium]|nr:MAG: hypothetical protein DWQ35_15885 [Planctomycetota bacterium]REK18287.1 MAG: hypothetical protein DWQ42_20630 [Planctomycetota bacterium]REK49157.1 MAG: hypothetical protein DWQ46_01230 [Planctomycetota bacterium]